MNSPIFDAMKNYSADGAAAFHTPGHKQGRGAHEFLKELVTPEGLRREVSLMEELDDLHNPQTCIKKAQELAAKLWGADDAFFMVNGTTGAIHTMIFSALSPGDSVFVPRNAHRSVISGLILSGAVPIFLPVEFSPELKIPLNLTPETVRRAVEKFPAAKALICVSPNYYGVAADLKEFAKILHSAGMLLLVDEAHGAHLNFSGKLPPSAINSGADAAAQSTHKILGSLTQTSMLMIREKRISRQKVQRAASLLQTTSPNYLLLASLDIARLQLEENGGEKISAAIKFAEKIRRRVNEIAGLKTFDEVKNFGFDKTKITVDVTGLNLSGIEAEKILRHDLKIQCELSDAANLLFLITYADDDFTTEKLCDGLKKLSEIRGDFKFELPPPLPQEICPVEISPRNAFFAETKFVDLKKSVGEICAEEITFYPPGIPILNPGEKISAAAVEYILAAKKFAGHAIGADDSNLNRIRVSTSATKFPSSKGYPDFSNHAPSQFSKHDPTP